jgi:hypothetical protein
MSWEAKMLKSLVIVVTVSAIFSASAYAEESVGPITTIPKTLYPVDNPTPPCSGNITQNDIAKLLQSAKGDNENANNAIQVVQDFFNKKSNQSNANCQAVCARVPAGASVEKIMRYWGPDGGALLDQPYSDDALDVWGPGPGWHMWEKKVITESLSDGDAVCTIFRNWSDTTARTARIKITY